jgi:hypothetical protein
MFHTSSTQHSFLNLLLSVPLVAASPEAGKPLDRSKPTAAERAP